MPSSFQYFKSAYLSSTFLFVDTYIQLSFILNMRVLLIALLAAISYAQTDVDCVGVWSSCDASCMQIYSITNLNSGKGAPCEYGDGEDRDCAPGVDLCPDVDSQVQMEPENVDQQVEVDVIEEVEVIGGQVEVNPEQQLEVHPELVDQQVEVDADLIEEATFMMECICPVGRRELMINPDFFDCELEGYELVSETNVIDCPDGSTMECGGPGYVCQNENGDVMDTIPAEPAGMTEIIEAPVTPELPEMPETPEVPEISETPDMLDAADTDTCADKACGDSCSAPCPPGLICPAVMKYCQADGSCGNAMPTPSGCGATTESTCDKDDWTDMKVDCGGCTALVHNFETYKTCNGYCASVGLQCVGAADDKRNTCYAQEDKNLSCDSTFDLFGGSSHDALCTCGGELPKPETPEAPEILKPAKVCKGLRRKDCDANTVCRWSKQKQKCKARPEPEKAENEKPEKEKQHKLLESTHEENKTYSTALILALTGISFFLGFFITYTKMKQRIVENVDMEYLNMAEA